MQLIDERGDVVSGTRRIDGVARRKNLFQLGAGRPVHQQGPEQAARPGDRQVAAAGAVEDEDLVVRDPPFEIVGLQPDYITRRMALCLT